VTLQTLKSPVVNFINILQAAFAPIFFSQKITKPNCNKRKAVQSTFVQKRHTYNVDEIDTLCKTQTKMAIFALVSMAKKL
jgi:hypothetical protein